MRRASRAASSVGRARASSRELVCRLWAPPRTAARAWIVVRTTLLSTDWAVRLDPAVWTWKRQTHRAGVRCPEPLAHDRGPHPAGGAELGDLLEQLRPGGEEEGQPAGEVVDVEPAGDGRLDVGDRVGQRERQLLGGGRPGLAHVVARDRDRVPLGQLAGAELEHVGHEPHRRPRREDVRAAGDVLLEDVVLGRPGDRRALDALGLGRGDVQRQQDRRPSR